MDSLKEENKKLREENSKLAQSLRELEIIKAENRYIERVCSTYRKIYRL